MLAVSVEEGQAVRVGAALGRIEARTLEDARRSAASAVRSAETQLSVATRVTVPEAITYRAPWASSASVSQDHPTAASIGSVTISISISARTYATQR